MRIPMDKINIRRLLTGLGLLVILLLAVAFVLGLLSLQRTREIVSEDFQQQQLILAKTTARQIEDGLEFLRRELKILNYSPAIQYLEEVAWANRMKVSFDDLSKLGVTEIVRLDFAGRLMPAAPISWTPKAPTYWSDSRMTPPKWPGLKTRPIGAAFTRGPLILQPEGDHKIPFFIMATPVYEESVDESHPKATGKLDGVLLFKIDASQFTGHYCADIRSGRTGYCWVMDNKGIFLYHPERKFIGEDAFTARGQRNPVISFAAINEIQKIQDAGRRRRDVHIQFGLAPGRHPADEQICGLHPCPGGRGLSYANLSRADIDAHGRPGCKEIWPVAVVAPTDEVYGTIHSLYIRQFLIQGILIFALILAACAVIYYEMRWSVELQREVDHATTNLRRSREQYKSVVENARDFIFLLDEKGTFISANTAAARAFGTPAAGIAGKPLSGLFAPDDAAALLTQVQRRGG